jgi:phosphoglycerol transferase
VFVVFLAFFVVRGVGLEPLVFADEWMHSVNTRLVPLTDVSSPSYLYYYLYRPTRACNFAFLECARLINIAVFFAAALAFFFFALRYVGTWVAIILLAVFLAAPSNVYLLLFSPDALFHSLFVIFFVSLFVRDERIRALASGTLLGLLALIKINAILLLPGLLLFLVLERRADGAPFSGYVASVLLATAAFFISKAAVGYLLAGPNGLSITGAHYSGVASQARDVSILIERLPLIAFSVAGYLASALLLLGTPILSLVWAAGPDRTLARAAVCILLPLLLVFGVFAALVADAGPYESIKRLSLRYFSFVFPFFYLLAVSVLTKLSGEAVAAIRTRIMIAFAVIVMAAMIFVLANDYQPNLNESPELTFLTFNRLSLIAGSALLLVPPLVIAFRPSLAAPAYLGALVLVALIWNVVALRELRFSRVPSPFDAAGRHAALFLGPARADVAVASADLSGLFRVMFHLSAVGPLGVQPTGTVAREELVRQMQTKHWALLIGPEALTFAPRGTEAPNGFALVPSAALVR